MRTHFVVLLFTSILSTAANAAGFAYEGVLTNSAGAPITDPVDMTLKIFGDSGGACELYSQTFSAVTPDAKGFFSLEVDGSGSVNANATSAGATTLSEIFTNSTACTNSPDRYLQLSFDPDGLGSAPVESFDYTKIDRVPYAMTADNIAQNGANPYDVLKWNGSTWAPAVDEDNGITALTGDVTASGPGSQGATIAAGAVTFAKIQNINSNKILGRSGAGSGSAEEIAIGGGLSLTGGTLSANGGTGTVTSVDITGPGFLDITGGPITTSGALDIAFVTQTSGLVLAGPASGVPAAPDFRALVATDIPALDSAKITTGSFAATRIGGGTVDDTEFGYLDGVTSAIQTQIGSLTTALGDKLGLTGGTMSGNITMDNETGVLFREGTVNGSQGINIKAPNALASSYTLTLPPDDGAGGEVLTTNGSGVLTWTAPGGVGDITEVVAGNGLETGGTIGAVTVDVKVDNATLEINSDALRIKDAGVTDAKINDVAWGKVTGEPTTLTGYGITDGIKNGGGVVSYQADVLASRPTAGTAGRFYLSTDNDKIYRDDGSTWVEFKPEVDPQVSSSTSGKVATWNGSALVDSNIFSNATQVGINTSSPAATAILDLTSTTLGFLMPRMTDTARDDILTPATGLQIYNTTSNQINYYNGSAWVSLAAAGGGPYLPIDGTAEMTGALTLGGNILYGASTSGGNLILESTSHGTKGNIQINGTATSGNTILNETSGNVGIGIASPTRKLHMVGAAQAEFDYSDTNTTGTNYGLILSRSTSNGASPGSIFGTGIRFDLEGFTNNSYATGAGSISAFWEAAQTDDTTTRDSAMTFKTMSNNSAAERLRITSAGKIGVGVQSPNYDFSFAGNGAKSIAMERNPTGSSSGFVLAITAGGASASGSNLNGGDLELSSGIARGNANSKIIFKVPANSAGGAIESAPQTALVISTPNLQSNQFPEVAIANPNVGLSQSMLTLNTSGAGSLLETNKGWQLYSDNEVNGAAFGLTYGNGAGGWTQNVITAQKTTGNVGIGVASASTKLDLNGALNVRGMAAPTASAAGQGRIYFDSTANKFKVSEHGGGWVDLITGATALPNGQIFIGNGSNVATAQSVSGAITITNAGVTSYAGTVPVSKGGTNLSATPANGQIPIGNGTDYTLATLSGTANRISVTNGSGTITLSTPQDIHNTASPTFSGISLGSASIGDGTTALPTIFFNTDTDTGIYSEADGVISFSGNGVEIGRINQSGVINAGNSTGDAAIDGAHFRINNIQALRMDTTNGNFVLGTGAGTIAATAEYNTFVGYSTGTGITSGDGNVFVGQLAGNAVQDGAYNTAIGYNANIGASILNSMAIGPYTTVTANNAIAIGYGASASTANSLNLGSTTNPINKLFLGKGESAVTAVTLDISNTSITSGTLDTGSGNINIKTGASTGLGNGGSISFQVTPAAGASASTLNTYVEKMRISPAGVSFSGGAKLNAIYTGDTGGTFSAGLLISQNTTSVVNVTVTGAQPGDVVHCSPDTEPNNNADYVLTGPALVTTANNVRFRLRNLFGSGPAGWGAGVIFKCVVISAVP